VALATSSDFLPALAHVNPWRSVLLAAVLISVVALIWEWPDAPVPFMVAWLLPVLLFAVELVSHRAYVTSDALVIESGPFLRRRLTYPLRDVTRVEYDRRGVKGMLDVGDIDILGEGWSVTLVSVGRPAESAQRILDAKMAAQAPWS
jgi:hypothetical protein